MALLGSLHCCGSFLNQGVAKTWVRMHSQFPTVPLGRFCGQSLANTENKGTQEVTALVFVIAQRSFTREVRWASCTPVPVPCIMVVFAKDESASNPFSSADLCRHPCVCQRPHPMFQMCKLSQAGISMRYTWLHASI